MGSSTRCNIYLGTQGCNSGKTDLLSTPLPPHFWLLQSVEFPTPATSLSTLDKGSGEGRPQPSPFIGTGLYTRSYLIPVNVYTHSVRGRDFLEGLNTPSVFESCLTFPRTPVSRHGSNLKQSTSLSVVTDTSRSLRGVPFTLNSTPNFLSTWLSSAERSRPSPDVSPGLRSSWC